MKKQLQDKNPSASENGNVFLSPTRVSTKHHATPLKAKCKTLKIGEGEDVHTQSANPVTPRSKLSRSKNISPCGSSLANNYYLGACSQELPEVIWDYNSANLNDGIGQSIRSLTINDLLSNIQEVNQMSTKETVASSTTSDARSSVSYSNMIEKWMEFQKSPASHRVASKYPPRMLRKTRHTRHVLEELEAVFNSAQRTNCETVIEEECIRTTSDKEIPEGKEEEAFSSGSLAVNLDEENEFQDELWGEDADNDLIRASQEVESMLANQDLSTNDRSIPVAHKNPCPAETQSAECTEKAVHRTFEGEKTENSNRFGVAPLKCSSDADSIVRQSDLVNDWDADFIGDDWNDSFLLETSVNTIESPCNAASMASPVVDDAVHIPDKNKSPDVSTAKDDPKNQRFLQNHERISRSSEELFADFGDFSDDDALFEDSETVDWDNQVINEDSPPKCTPVEIAQKKELALRKLKERKKGSVPT